MNRRNRSTWKPLTPGLFLCEDTCNVYLLKQGEGGVAFDFGSGAWLDALPEIGIRELRHVFLTHAHRDSCAGLARRDRWPFEVHASTEDLAFYRPEPLAAFWNAFQAAGCPASYAAPRQPLPFVQGDVGEAREIPWGILQICAIPTPGHTRGALTYLVVHNDEVLAFCGDAVHAGGTVYQPYHLEWDHWTPGGAREAWYGLERLAACRIDRLCPAHGPVVGTRPTACIRTAQRRLMAFIRAKGSVCPGERDRWAPTEPLACGAHRVLPGLYRFGANSYLLTGENGEGLVIDPTLPDIAAVEPLMAETGVRTLTAATATHYHRDHSDGLNWLRDRHGAAVWLHPWVAEPLEDRNRFDLPWLPAESVRPDRRLPETGRFTWNRYRFEIRPFPGQTRWHCAFDTRISGVHVLFSGDNFQPPTRWNGTGGFCAYNGSRFADGFSRSARTVLDIAPDLIANGHGCIYRYDPGHYRRILRWSQRAERAVRDLCPDSDEGAGYDCRAQSWSPFRIEIRPGAAAASRFRVRNPAPKPLSIAVRAIAPSGWTVAPSRRTLTVPARSVRSTGFTFTAPPETAAGRYLIAADVVADGAPKGETAMVLVDVREHEGPGENAPRGLRPYP